MPSLVFGNKLTCIELYSGRTFQIGKEKTEVVEGKVDVSKLAF